jgi:hypothetical protein
MIEEEAFKLGLPFVWRSLTSFNILQESLIIVVVIQSLEAVHTLAFVLQVQVIKVRPIHHDELKNYDCPHCNQEL